MNLAYVSPLPPLHSGIADYSAILLPQLRPYFSRIVAVVDGSAPSLPPGIVDQVYDVSADQDWWLDARAVPLYHMGNHLHYHSYIYRSLQRFPGITVLHDGNLLPFVHDATLAAGNRRDFIREAGFERGGDGITAAWAALRSSEPLCLEDYPMLARVVSSSLGVIVHNHYLRGRIEALACPKVPIAVIPMLNMMRPEAATPSRREAKEALGLDPDGMLVGTFGFIASSKRLDQALEAFSRLRDRFPGIRFVCVGELAPEYDFAAVVTRLGLRDCVHVTGYTPMEMFRRYLYAVDAGLNLRHPTWGESSASLVRMMACGIPTLVSDVGAFAELADETVVKVPVGSGEVDAIASALRALLSDADLRTRIGAAARAYVEGQCAPKKVAEQYAAFIYRVIRTGSSIANR